MYGKQSFVVSCRSDQSGLLSASSTSSFFDFGPQQQHTVNGWTCDELVAAESIIHPARSENEIRNIHYYSGGSARYYFKFCERVSTLIMVLDDTMKRINDYNSFFSNNMENASCDVMNSLHTYREGVPLLVSKYVVRKFSENVSRNFISRAIGTLPDNDSWQGWCAELDFISRVRHRFSLSLPLVLRQIEDPIDQPFFQHPLRAMPIYMDNVLLLQPAAIDIADTNCVDGKLYVPVRYYNKGYDSIYIHYEHLPNGVIRPHVDVLQITVAHQHSKKLDSTAVFLNQLFPLGNTNPLFAPPVVRYLIVTRFVKYAAFEMVPGIQNGIESVQNFDNGFAFPGSFFKCYFDGDPLLNEGGGL